MKVAILDMGTNVFNLLITDVSEDGYEILKVLKVPSKIGEGGITKGILTQTAFDSARIAIGELKSAINEMGGVESFRGIATSAVRDAANSADFLSMVNREFGIEAEAISGNREAELIYKGVRESMLLYNEVFLIMDIGGGSNEFIIADKYQIYWKRSYNMGVVRLREMFPPSDPISEKELTHLERYYDENMSDLWEAVGRYKPTLLIGCSGSFDTLRELIYTEDDGTVPSMEIEKEKFISLHNKLIRSVREERAAMPGMSPIRVDYIVIGSILVNLVIEKTAITDIHQSSYSLKEGYMAEIYESFLQKKL
ncbi:MAG: phosphatase [Bacteroidetes bacterium HGW-Bacteroidetes-14]|jgi:exopolyphosphatase/guanosine-5'-triphosphate,3'-diphosphate pyrophosphatase|nr:MAG: phosphatase [Bacteroidetes bacterium HGW-Bacteroidetes-14]